MWGNGDVVDEVSVADDDKIGGEVSCIYDIEHDIDEEENDVSFSQEFAQEIIENDPTLDSTFICEN